MQIRLAAGDAPRHGMNPAAHQAAWHSSFSNNLRYQRAEAAGAIMRLDRQSYGKRCKDAGEVILRGRMDMRNDHDAARQTVSGQSLRRGDNISGYVAHRNQ